MAVVEYLGETLDRTKDSWGSAYILSYEGVNLPEKPGTPKVEVTSEKVQDAPLRFRGKKVTVLSFASGVNPGGGVRYGAIAQEEDLCRCSGLLHGLESLPAFYERNREKDAPPECYDMMIVSEDVPLVRNGRLHLVPPCPINVITYPAPNLHRGVFAERTEDPDFFPEDRGEVPDLPSVKGIFERRCAHIVHQAEALGTEVLVLGAWGCGEYGNDATLVAEAFKEALAKFSGTIPLVVFACFGYAPNREAFQRVFGEATHGA